jgi:hypothetical protein
MKVIVYHNREVFLVKDKESCQIEHIAFDWGDSLWGDIPYPLTNGVVVLWVKNYQVKKNIFIKYKGVTLLNSSYGYEGIAEIMNIYNNKTKEELERELLEIKKEENRTTKPGYFKRILNTILNRDN